MVNGAYKSRSIISSAQRQVNLFSEQNPGGAIIDIGEQQSAPVPTLYPAPGLKPLSTPPTPGIARGFYEANNGTLFYVCGATVYTVSATWALTSIGTIAVGTNLTSMGDNGSTMVLVDGTTSGYQVDLATGVFSPISGATNGPTVEGTFDYAFYGADRIAVVDGYMVFNQPGTRNFYITLNGEVVFDSLNIAAKNGYSDNLVAAVANQRVLWLIGEKTTEIFFDSGDAAFPFAVMPGPFVQHGCVAQFSISQLQESIFWLSQDTTGGGFVAVRTQGYTVQRVSTHAVEAEWSTYSTVADAEAFCFQQAGHQFYQLTFPSADKTWRYDMATGEWHEAVWTDSSGFEHRHRARCMAYANGVIVVADWETGALYQLDAATFDDAGAPITRRRGFPHIIGDGDRVFFRNVVLDMSVGNSVGTTAPPGPFPLLDGDQNSIDGLVVGPAPGPDTSPQVGLRWSDDRGRTWGNPIYNTLGATGQYLTSIQYNRLGFARDRVFEVFWSAPVDTALQGAWVTFSKASS